MALFTINIANVERITRLGRAEIETVDVVEDIDNVEELTIVEAQPSTVLVVRLQPPERRDGGTYHMSTLVNITDTQKQRFTYDPSTAKDAAGNPAAPLGPNTTVSVEGPDDSTVASISVNGLEVTVSSEDAVAGDADGSVGQTQARATISDPDSGVTITDVIAITVVGSAATQIGAVLSDPEPR